MNAALAYPPMLRRNALAIIGFCLAFYFGYHLVQGERSYLRLVALENTIARSEKDYAALDAQRAETEKKVRMMRPGSINRDLLEERVRDVLGYVRPDERILLERGG